MSYLDLASAVLSSDWGSVQRTLSEHPPVASELMTWLRRHHLAGQFSAALEESPVIDAFPCDFLKEGRQRFANQSRHNARVQAATVSAVTTLSRCDIPALLLKGIHYAERFHGGVDRRFLWDIDLLIPRDRYQDALNCLARNAYTTQTNAFWNNRLTRQLTHAVSLTREDIEVDLHRYLRNRPAYRIDYSALWSTYKTFCIGEDSFTVPSDDYCLLTLLLGIANDLEVGRFKLKLMFDLDRMLRTLDTDMDWEGFFCARENECLASLCANILAIYLVLFESGDKLPRLLSTLNIRQDDIQAYSKTNVQRLIEAPRQSLYNRRWYASIYPDGPLAYALWWSLTAPIRFAIGRTT